MPAKETSIADRNKTVSRGQVFMISQVSRFKMTYNILPETAFFNEARGEKSEFRDADGERAGEKDGGFSQKGTEQLR